MPGGLPNAVRVSVDDADIRALERRIETSYQSAQSAAFGTRWRDEGYWLLVPLALIGVLWFRRGVTVAWLILFAVLQLPPSAGAAESSRWRDLFVTSDQQGRLAFDRGDYAAAKPHGERANELAPDNAAVMDTLGVILLETGETDKGRRRAQSRFHSGDAHFLLPRFHFLVSFQIRPPESERRRSTRPSGPRLE